MSTLRGVAVITGAAGITLTAGIISATNAGHNQNISHTREADHKFVKSGSGDSVADFITDKRQMLTITVVPYHATTLASARTSNDAYKLPAGTKVTVADSDGAIIDGDYLLMSSKETRPNDANNVIDLELQKWDDNDLTLIPS